MADDWETMAVRLTADVSQYRQALNQAAKATSTFATDADKATKATTAAYDKLGGSTSATARQIKSSTDQIGASTKALGSSWMSSWSGMGAVTAAAATAVGFSAAQIGSRLVRMAADAVRSAMDFQTAILNVASLGGESTASIGRLSAAVLDMAKSMPQSAGVLAEGLYDIESSGFAGAQALDVLKSSGVAASAGLTDTATSARAITAVLNSYGMSGADASHVSDVLFQTVNSGVVSFEELAQNIGDVVPMAAAMGISLEQATGALATMTLAGLPAAEAATSTARVMQAFIKPSDAMAETMSRLGITMDDLKNPAVGLSGVMGKLAKDTGGSTSALQALFPDVRSLRGALALAANDGQTYARVMAQQAKASEGAGAAAKAFAIQMESLSAKWTIFKNRVSSVSIAAITAAFPIVEAAAKALGDLLGTVGDRIHSTWTNLQDVFAHLATILGTVVDAVKPVASYLATMVGAAVITAVHGLAVALSSITGVLAEHPALIRAVTVAFAAWAGIQGVTALAGTLSVLSKGFDRLAIAAYDAAGATVTLRSAFATAWPIAAIAAGAAALESLATASKRARDEVGRINDKGTGKGLEGLRATINDSAAAGIKASKSLDSYGATWKRVAIGVAQSLTPLKNHVADATAAQKKLLEQNTRNIHQFDLMDTHYDRLSYNLGISRNQVNKLVLADKDLNLATATTAQVTASVNGTLDKLSQKTGLAKTQVKSLLDAMTPEQLEEFSKQMGKVGDAVSSSVAQFGSLTSVQGLIVSTDLTLNPNQIAANTGIIEQFYRQRLAAARQFSTDMTDAIAQGYDASTIMDLVQAGPEKAGPILRTLVGGYSAEMVELVNSAAAQIDALASATAEKARAMYRATTLSSDRLTKDLPTYQRVVDMAAAGMKAPEIALRLGLHVADFNHLMTEFGNTQLRLQAEADKKPVRARVTVATGDFDKDIDTVKTRLDAVNYLAVAPEVDLDLAGLLTSKKIADAELKSLTKERRAIIKAGADPLALAKVDRSIAMLTATRTAVVKAKGDPASIDVTKFQLDYLTRLRNALVAAHAPKAEIDAAEGALNALTHPRTATVTVDADISRAIAKINAVVSSTAHMFGFADGGIHGYAQGGVRGFAAGGVTGRQLFTFGEPSTGGEAFIPRRGISSVRAKKIMDVAAGWHGLSVQAPAPSYVGPAPAMAPASGPSTVDRSVHVTFEPGAIQADGLDAGSAADMVAQRLTFRLATAGGAR